MINQLHAEKILPMRSGNNEKQGRQSRAAASRPLPLVYHTSHGAMCCGGLYGLTNQDSWMNGVGVVADETHEQDARESYPSILFESGLLQRACWMQAQKPVVFVCALAASLQAGFRVVLFFFFKGGQYDQEYILYAL